MKYVDGDAGPEPDSRLSEYPDVSSYVGSRERR